MIFAQMVDDPSAHPDLFPMEKKQEKERRRLFKIIEDLVLWENTTNETVLQRACDEIWQSWRYACAENADHPRAKELFNRYMFPDLFATLAVPKAEELIATPYRHESKEKAKTFFLDGMTLAMHRLAEQAHPALPVTIYYAFKQSETETDVDTASTGWETFLDAVIRAGFTISGTWPMRTELAEQEGDFDADSRFGLAWFEQHSFGEGPYGVAEVLSKTKNTSIAGMETAGILSSQGGRVCLLRPDELPAQWDPATDSRLTIWEIVHHLTHALETGEEKAAQLLARIRAVSPDKADAARELAYRLYTLCERKKRAQEALAYNGLVVSWPELMQRAQTAPAV